MNLSKHLCSAALLLSLATPLETAHAATGCALKKLAELPITWRGPDGKSSIQFPGSIKGQALSVGLFYGTETDAWIGEKTAARLGWPIETKHLGIPITETVRYVELGDLRLGMAEIAGLDALAEHNAKEDAPDIAIGPQALASFDVEYDLAHDRIALFSSEHCPNQAVYWTKDWFEVPFRPTHRGAIAFDIKVNGNTVEASLQPRSFFSSVTPRIQPMIGVVPVPGKDDVIIARLEFGGIAMKDVHADSFHLAVRDLPNDTTYAGNPQKFDMTDFNFGLKEMKKFRIFVSHLDQKIFFTLPDDK